MQAYKTLLIKSNDFCLIQADAGSAVCFRFNSIAAVETHVFPEGKLRSSFIFQEDAAFCTSQTHCGGISGFDRFCRGKDADIKNECKDHNNYDRLFHIGILPKRIWLSVFCFGFLLALKYNTSGITELSHKVLAAHPVSVYNTGRKLKRSFSCFLKVKIQEKSRQGVDPAGLNKVGSFKIRRARYCQHIRGWRGRLRRCRTLRHS